MQVCRRELLAAGAAVAGLSLLPSVLHPSARAAGEPTQPEGTIRYRILRQGATLGEHETRVVRVGSVLEVENDMEIVARLLGIPVYRYEHRSREVWHDGRLTRVEARTNKDGKRKALEVERREHALHVMVDGERRRVAGDILTTSLWHRDTPFQRQLLDIEDGKLHAVEGHDLGEETVPVAGTPQSARHHRIARSDRPDWRHVWYDKAGRLVRVEFVTRKDGSRITLEPTVMAG